MEYEVLLNGTSKQKSAKIEISGFSPWDPAMESNSKEQGSRIPTSVESGGGSSGPPPCDVVRGEPPAGAPAAAAAAATAAQQQQQEAECVAAGGGEGGGGGVRSTAVSHGTRVHVLRLLPGQDLLQELERFAVEAKVQAGFVQTCVGTLASACLQYPGCGEDSARLVQLGECEIIGLNGTLSSSSSSSSSCSPQQNPMQPPSSLPLLHLILSSSSASGGGGGAAPAFTAGHVARGCIVKTRVELVVGVIEGVSFTRQHDDQTGQSELFISEGDPPIRSTKEVTPYTFQPPQSQGMSDHHTIQVELENMSDPTDTASLVKARVHIPKSLNLWNFIAGDDAVGLPPEQPRLSFLQYIAGEDQAMAACFPKKSRNQITSGDSSK